MKQKPITPNEFSLKFQVSYNDYWTETKKIDKRIQKLEEQKKKIFFPC